MKSGLQLHEQTTLRSVTMFTVNEREEMICDEMTFHFQSNYIEYAKSNPRAASLLQQNGLEMIQILLKVMGEISMKHESIAIIFIQCIGGGSPRHLVDTLSLPLFTLSKFYVDWTSNWVQQCLNDPNFPTPSPKRHHRDAFIKAITS